MKRPAVLLVDTSRMSRLLSLALHTALGVALGLALGAATAITIIVFGAGVFWLYVFGDDPWPSYATAGLTVSAHLAGLIVLLATIAIWLRYRSARV